MYYKNSVFDEVSSPDGQWELRLIDGVPTGMAFRCPGCGAESYVGLEPPAAITNWTFDGSLEAPTLTPSILQSGCCKWHGYMKAGKFEAAP